MGAPVFNQPNWEVSGDVYNTAGDLILRRDSSRDDLRRALAAIRDEIRNAPGLDPARRDAAVTELDLAAGEADKAQPDKVSLAQRLKAVGQTLEGGAGAAEGALKLARTVFSIAKWIGLFLA